METVIATDVITKSYLYEGIALPGLIAIVMFLGTVAFFFAKAWLKSQNTILDGKFTTFENSINNTIKSEIKDLRNTLENYASKSLVEDVIKRVDKSEIELLKWKKRTYSILKTTEHDLIKRGITIVENTVYEDDNK